MDIKYSAVVNLPELLRRWKDGKQTVQVCCGDPAGVTELLLMSMKQVVGEEVFEDTLKRFKGAGAGNL
ncbi:MULTISPECIES: hypothetical protein [unclassified Archaeoglobus]|jgi:hypothetical protein|uniref:hypothetical protein n=1 Tax=unclassified Archaeoglobus TaxID=2643606 RepID=UPI0025BA92F5|nr:MULTISPECIES: hypothetical protein [unclassified Archaeoglobus]